MVAQTAGHIMPYVVISRIITREGIRYETSDIRSTIKEAFDTYLFCRPLFDGDSGIRIDCLGIFEKTELPKWVEDAANVERNK